MQNPLATEVAHQRPHQRRGDDKGKRTAQPHLAVIEVRLHHHAGRQRLPHRHQGRIDKVRQQGQAHQPPKVMTEVEAEKRQQTEQGEQSGNRQQMASPLDLPHHHQVAGKADRHPRPQQETYHLGADAHSLQPERPERQVSAVDKIEGAEKER